VGGDVASGTDGICGKEGPMCHIMPVNTGMIGQMKSKLENSSIHGKVLMMVFFVSRKGKAEGGFLTSSYINNESRTQ
jgi:hypothetical protein